MTEGISGGSSADFGAENPASKDIAPKKSFENTRKLFQDAMEQGIVYELLLSLSPRRRQQLKAKMGIASDYIRTDSTLEEVGAKYGLFRQGVYAKVKDVITSIYNAGDNQFKKDHPLAGIVYGKPAYSRKSALRRSETVSGPGAKVIRAMEILGITGVTPDNFEKVAEFAGISVGDIRHIRPSLRNSGINIPEADPPIFRDFAERIRKENDYVKLQEILNNSFPLASLNAPNSLRAYLNRHGKDEQKVLTDLSSVVRDAGFFPHGYNLQEFADKIKEKGLPIIIRSTDLETKKGKIIQTYYVVPCKCAETIKETLRNDPELQRFRKNPVELICGTPEKMPNTTDLMRDSRGQSGGQYSGGLAVLARETIGFVTDYTKPDWNLAVLMKYCPVPVFRYKGKYYFPADKVGEIMAYLRQKQGLEDRA